MRDSRLELGRYVRNPFNKRGQISKRLDFVELFQAQPQVNDYPWNPSRFTERDLTKRAMARKLTENPGLNFVGNAPFFDGNENVTADYEVFEGIGRFKGDQDYNFEDGRPITTDFPQNQPDYNPGWMERYNFSPTIKPDERAKDPMPRNSNPDPNGYLQMMAEQQFAEDQAGAPPTAGQILTAEGGGTEEDAQTGNAVVRNQEERESRD